MLTRTLAAAGFVASGSRLARAGSASPQCPSVNAPPTVLPTLSGPPLGTMAASRNLLLGAQMGIADNPAYGPPL